MKGSISFRVRTSSYALTANRIAANIHIFRIEYKWLDYSFLNWRNASRVIIPTNLPLLVTNIYKSPNMINKKWTLANIVPSGTLRGASSKATSLLSKSIGVLQKFKISGFSTLSESMLSRRTRAYFFSLASLWLYLPDMSQRGLSWDSRRVLLPSDINTWASAYRCDSIFFKLLMYTIPQRLWSWSIIGTRRNCLSDL